ncbi:DUF6630 family protein [Novipirellula sp. SH528]|uniref:DUF6630 family protein n=1 Tax=Novipirellula sp. SH528 TaxID=3454466 RepID=UPI003FA01ECD
MRRLRLGHGDTRNALVALGTEPGIAWLEEHIESPIGPEWGRLLYELKPGWAHLDRWIRGNKIHCLAAVDALLSFTANPYSDDDNEPELPLGADPAAINDALNYALDHYDNPRLQDAAKRIRHVWPVGTPTRNAISVPAPLEEFATILFDNDTTLMNRWNESLASALTGPENAADHWHSLLQFSDRNDVVAVVDWRAFPDSIVGRLQCLRSANGLPIPWKIYANYDGEIEELFRELNAEVKGSERLLVSLDTGSDSYALIFVGPDTIPTLESLIASALKEPSTIQRFD